jgi:hypothetical protein
MPAVGAEEGVVTRRLHRHRRRVPALGRPAGGGRRMSQLRGNCGIPVLLLVGFAQCTRWGSAMGRALNARNARNNGKHPIFYHFGLGNAKRMKKQIWIMLHWGITTSCFEDHVRLDEIPVPGLDTPPLSLEKSRRLSYGRKSNRVTGCTFRLQD